MIIFDLYSPHNDLITNSVSSHPTGGQKWWVGYRKDLDLLVVCGYAVIHFTNREKCMLLLVWCSREIKHGIWLADILCRPVKPNCDFLIYYFMPVVRLAFLPGTKPMWVVGNISWVDSFWLTSQFPDKNQLMKNLPIICLYSLEVVSIQSHMFSSFCGPPMYITGPGAQSDKYWHEILASTENS